MPRGRLWPVVTLLLALALPAPAALAHGGPAHARHSRSADRLLQRGVVTLARPGAHDRPARRPARPRRGAPRPSRRSAAAPPARRPRLHRRGGHGRHLVRRRDADRPAEHRSTPRRRSRSSTRTPPTSRRGSRPTAGSSSRHRATAAEVVEARAGGSRTLRFDMGSSCGNRYLDIASVALPETKAWYQQHQQVDTAAIRAQLGLPVGEVNMVVWADEIGTGQQPLGVAQTYLDDRAGGRERQQLRRARRAHHRPRQDVLLRRRAGLRLGAGVGGAARADAHAGRRPERRAAQLESRSLHRRVGHHVLRRRLADEPAERQRR